MSLQMGGQLGSPALLSAKTAGVPSVPELSSAHCLAGAPSISLLCPLLCRLEWRGREVRLPFSLCKFVLDLYVVVGGYQRDDRLHGGGSSA
jgi:hypothetical protein